MCKQDMKCVSSKCLIWWWSAGGIYGWLLWQLGGLWNLRLPAINPVSKSCSWPSSDNTGCKESVTISGIYVLEPSKNYNSQDSIRRVSPEECWYKSEIVSSFSALYSILSHKEKNIFSILTVYMWKFQITQTSIFLSELSVPLHYLRRNVYTLRWVLHT